ncbi:MAG: hypothetical protein SV598_10700, partial [Pseudomonadota bacterium]|nr:hypothetical protein [Pseudomonadota bacterium]
TRKKDKDKQNQAAGNFRFCGYPQPIFLFAFLPWISWISWLLIPSAVSTKRRGKRTKINRTRLRVTSDSAVTRNPFFFSLFFRGFRGFRG